MSRFYPFQLSLGWPIISFEKTEWNIKQTEKRCAVVLARSSETTKACRAKYRVEASDPIYNTLTGLVDEATLEGDIWFDEGQQFTEIIFALPAEPRGKEIPLDKIQIVLLPSEQAEKLQKMEVENLENENNVQGSKISLNSTASSGSGVSDDGSSAPYLLGEHKLAVINIENDVNWACVNFQVQDVSINQSEKTIQIPILRSDRPDNRVRVHWTISAPDEEQIYSSMKGILTIDPNSNFAEIPIELYPRPLDCPTSKFTITIGPGISGEAYLGDATTCEVEVVNNVGKYKLSLSTKNNNPVIPHSCGSSRAYACKYYLECVRVVSSSKTYIIVVYSFFFFGSSMLDHHHQFFAETCMRVLSV